VSRARLIRDLLRRGRTLSYGSDRSQRADLYLPAGDGPHPVMVVIHGGSWQARYGRVVMRGLSGDLLRRGWAAWNIEYRRVGNGGGWPHTFADVAAAIDHLGELAAPIDLARVHVLGHSAGGHLALWAAAREHLPPGAPGFREGGPRVQLRRAIAQAGVCDLTGAHARWHGGAAAALMGGGPQQLPDRYALGDPARLPAARMPVLLVHGLADETVSIELSRSYLRSASAGGGEVQLVELAGPAGRHRAHIDPRGAAWAEVLRWLAPNVAPAHALGARG